VEVTLDVLVDFAAIPWETGTGVRSKSVVRRGRRVRLVEFSEGFEEPGWCTAGHAGQVLEGTCTLRTREGDQRLEAGDVIAIPAGDQGAHKAVLGPGERVLLLLFENV
jgi:quercetin dioxygenase-like cupin family protein